MDIVDKMLPEDLLFEKTHKDLTYQHVCII